MKALSVISKASGETTDSSFITLLISYLSKVLSTVILIPYFVRVRDARSFSVRPDFKELPLRILERI